MMGTKFAKASDGVLHCIEVSCTLMDNIVMETEFATTSDRLLCHYLHYIGGFEALYMATMSLP
jgi:hypothetical protein